MLTKRHIIIPLMLLATLTMGQMIRITPYKAPTALFFDADRLLNYNRYEGARFEASLSWVIPNVTAENPKTVLGQWTMQAYGAYGTRDHEFKFGGGVQLRLPGRADPRIRIQGYKDVFQVASRRLESYKMTSPHYNTNFVSSRYAGVRGAGLELMLSPSRMWDMSFTLRQTWEDYRFNNDGLLYPLRYPEQRTEMRTFSEAAAKVVWGKGVSLQMKGGICTTASGEQHKYFNGIAQYNAEPGDFGLNVFAQVGYASPDAPYSRMFDLSGTAYAIYYFRNTFLTVRPNTFAANYYAHLCLNYTAPMPLWELSWSQPQPFLQINAMWGRLCGQDELGRRHWDGLYLQAPYMGLFEPATGFDGLLRYGVMDLGFGVAYQICPTSAPYIYDKPSKNITITIVATLVFDKQKRNIQHIEKQNGKITRL